MQFEEFKQLMQDNFAKLVENKQHMFLTDVSKDEIWDAYLQAFPEEEKQQHNCNSCRQFLKPYANLVVIEDNKLKSIWDFECESPFKEVAHSLHRLILSKPIRDVFVNPLRKIGTDFNFQQLEDGGVKRWNHFHLVLPSKFVTPLGRLVTEDSVRGTHRTNKEVFKRALDEISIDALETVIDLIGQNSLYRGAEYLANVQAFLALKRIYDNLRPDQKDNFAWERSMTLHQSVSKVRNTAIGTLLVDITEGKELDYAVGAFERIMAPANYKRPNAILSKKMIEDAQKKLAEMGLTDSLGRRYAIPDDITVDNLLFVDRSIKKSTNVFEELSEGTPVNIKKLSKVEEISIEDFITKVLPTASAVSTLVENDHVGNLVSLVAPVEKEAPSLFKWANGFSWSYNNNVADSMKERVKAAGGNVTGVLRFSIQWNDNGNNNIDFDAHAIEPNGTHIYFGSYRAPRITPTSGQLDVDIVSPNGQVAVENITWVDRSKMQEGTYKFFVNNYSSRTSNGGFTAEVECDGEVFKFGYPKNLKGNENIGVAEVHFSRTKGLTILKSLETNSTVVSKDVWGVKTNQFQKVAMIMASPNYWDGQGVGNKHYFFVMDKCKNPDQPRGFYNEFLKEDLMQQKRVFEALGDKMKVAPSDTQLSGLGFSSTNKGHVVCKVEGAFSRVLKVNF